jgi:hypothetical protein
VRQASVRGWENGTIPLFGVPYGQLHQLAETLNSLGATFGNDVNELLLASQCDVLIIGMLSGEENYAEVPPIGERTPEGATADALLRWAAQGAIPAEYLKLAPATPLLANLDVKRLAEVAHELASGAFGRDIASYGTAVLSCIGAVSSFGAPESDDHAVPRRRRS